MLYPSRRILLASKTVAELSIRCSSKKETTKSKVWNDTIVPEIPVTHELHNIVKWRQPEKLHFMDPRKSCDLDPLPQLDPNCLKLEYQPFAEQINKLPDDQRKWFTIEFQTRSDVVKVIYENTFKKVRRHKYDGIVEKSHEFLIAEDTIDIRERSLSILTDGKNHNQRYREECKLRDTIIRRKDRLRELRALDYKRFEWLLEVLGIMFKPDGFYEKLHRRYYVIRLTDIICKEIIEAKMRAYKQELEGEKVPFLEEKLAILQEIRGDEESMGLSPSVTHEIETTIKRLEDLKRTHLEIHPLRQQEIDHDVELS